MKKNLVKALSLLLVLVFALGVFAGCKGGKNKQQLEKDSMGVYYLDSDGNKVYKIVMMDHGIPNTSTEYKYRQLILDKVNEKLLKDRGYKVDIQIDVYSDDTFEYVTKFAYDRNVFSGTEKLALKFESVAGKWIASAKNTVSKYPPNKVFSMK